MKFKLTASLDNLANESGLSISEFTQIVISQLIKSEAIEDIPDLWGLTIKEAVDGGTNVKTLSDILYNTGIPIVTNRHFDALLELVIIGDSTNIIRTRQCVTNLKGRCPIACTVAFRYGHITIP